jgi:uncharacterized repeat protein (TIGR03803 family)
MKHFGLRHYAFSISAAAALLAGCGALPLSPSKGQDDTQPPIGAPGMVPQTAAVATRVDPSTMETVLYSFAGGNDGQYPDAAPISVDGEFYGTTALGGNGGCNALPGCGTVYKLNASGQESILHVFKSGTDGEAPNGLIDVGGNLIGTTTYGGTSGCKSEYTSGCGTVFELTPSGQEHVLYRFHGHAQGALPSSQLTLFKGEFYGEASAGGTGTCYYADYPGCGMIFKMSPSGHVSIIYTFKGGKDAGSPDGGLVWYKGAFYGTTLAGGSHACYSSYGCGTVFKITPSGSETTLHKFTGYPNDGALPDGLAIIDGVLYGTTDDGGKYNCGLTYYVHCGTVFTLTLSGRERVIYNFKGEKDGESPNGLVAVGGNLYGTTQSGGNEGSSCYFPGCGTVFELTPSGQETILYSFKGGRDGSLPSSPLIDVDGTLYGTTSVGGAKGDGTVFAVTP